MNDITVFVGGSLGSQPYGARTWSGMSRNLLAALDRAGHLRAAFGLEPTALERTWFRARTFSSHRAAWRKRYYLNVGYRNALTRAAAKVKLSSPIALQIGHWFSLPDAFPDAFCVSYHDGNLAQSSGSGYGMSGVPRKVIDAALRYEEETAQKMGAVFTFSEYLRQSFIHDYRVDAAKVFNIGAGAEPQPMPEEQPEKDHSQPVVLFVGIDFQRKGGVQLLQAFRQVRAAFPTAELHIVGPDSIAEALGEGVTLHGRLSKSDPVQSALLDGLFRRASLFTLPSLYEPFGLAPVEAMYYQVPCLLSDAWAFREMVTPGETGDLAQVGSVDDLAFKMIALLREPVKLRAMGRNARARVLNYYRWDALEERMLSALRR